MADIFLTNFIRVKTEITTYLKRINNKYLGLVFLHALWLLFLTVIFQYTEFVRFDEIGFLQSITFIKNNILGIDPKPLQGNTIYIDVSKDIQLTADGNLSQGIAPAFEGARTVITDRTKLARLFGVLNTHPNYKYILCDILFDKPSEQDLLLKKEIEKTPHIISSAILNGKKLISPIFDIKYVVVNYLQNVSAFTKMPLIYKNGDISMPAVMLGDITKKKISGNAWLAFLDGRPVFNKVFTELFIRSEDLKRAATNGKKANLFYLGDLLYLDDDSLFSKYLKGNYIILGDFTNDMHNTYRGQQPGPLILWNTFLTLENNRSTPDISWFLLMYIIYFFISAGIFNPLSTSKLGILYEKIKINSLKKLLKKYLSWLGVFLAISILTYLMESIIVSIFYLVSYLTFFELVIEKRAGWKNKTVKEIIEDI